MRQGAGAQPELQPSAGNDGGPRRESDAGKTIAAHICRCNFVVSQKRTARARVGQPAASVWRSTPNLEVLRTTMLRRERWSNG
jgi:hypothetical protein